MIAERLARRAAALAAERVPFVQATVVRASRPASVRPGATALVLGDGMIEGFVGGHCAEPSVRMHALRALETGEALLLRIEPGNGEADAIEGAVTVHNPCISGGALEIFLEPHVPAARLHVIGETPIALALCELARGVGYDVAPHAGGELELARDDAAVVVASHGRDEEHALGAALTAGVPYVGLVASRTRGAAVAAGLDVSEDDRRRLHTPAGLDIGARTPEEIALAILAEIVSARRTLATPVAVTAPGDHEGHEGHCCHE
jgi:xanthine dehydrogenase accessory factor